MFLSRYSKLRSSAIGRRVTSAHYFSSSKLFGRNNNTQILCSPLPGADGSNTSRIVSCRSNIHGSSRFSPASFSTAAGSTTEDTSNEQKYEFKAETRQLLDIVTHSLYTDREVFLRELVSNASDACEKLRHLQAANALTANNNEDDLPLEIRITTNEKDQTLTISDTGIGFTKNEMIQNLGTIAASGSKAFVQALKARPAEDTAGITSASQGIIGKFGVGFYSAFMVGDSVHVQSRSEIKKV